MVSVLETIQLLIRQVFALRAKEGPYRFLVRQWRRVNDIDLALRVVQTQFFQEEMIPVSLPTTSVQSILVLAPHQDDEVIGAGGAMLIASRAGARIDIVYVTDGELIVPNAQISPYEMSEIRFSEAENVCARLKARMHRLGISNLQVRLSLEHVDRLAEIISALRPEIVLAPWILDSPVKHRMVNHLLYLAYKRACLSELEVWGYQVHNPLFPNGYVDITAVAEEKYDLLRLYQSQIKYLYRYDHMTMGMDAWNCRFLPSYKGDPIARYIEVFFTVPCGEFLELVERFYLRDLGKTYRNRRQLIRQFARLHRQTVGG